MNTRFELLATEARKDRRNINGLMALLQAASGDFDERIGRARRDRRGPGELSREARAHAPSPAPIRRSMRLSGTSQSSATAT